MAAGNVGEDEHCSRLVCAFVNVVFSEHEIELLKGEIKRLGKEVEGKWVVKFGVIVKDERCVTLLLRVRVLANGKKGRCGDLFEALVGTLKAAKKRKVHFEQGFEDRSARALVQIIDYKSELLLSPTHDAVDIVLL